MKKYLTNKTFLLFIYTIGLTSLVATAQTKSESEPPISEKKEYTVADLDEKPEFPGGINEFYNYIAENYKLPKVEGLKGKVYTTFVIEKDGSVVEAKILRDIGYGTGEETLRVLQNSPKWTPGKLNGAAVRVLYALPINIKTPEKEDPITSPENLAKKPTFPGGMQKFYQFIGENYRIPEVEGLNGKIFITFVVEKNGSLSNIKVIKDLGYGTGEEAIRVLQLAPYWIPGKLANGQPARTFNAIPITIKPAFNASQNKATNAKQRIDQGDPQK